MQDAPQPDAIQPDAIQPDALRPDARQDETPRAPDAPPRRLTPEAERALAEAADRRAAVDARAAAIAASPEHLGRGGLEPVRYEDWEVKGLAVDF